MYLNKDEKYIYEKLNDRWEICVSVSNTDKLEHYSFVNDNSTIAYFRKQDTDGTGSYLTVTESATPRVDLTGIYRTA